MGKGDQRTLKGKRFRGSFGKTRVRKSGVAFVASAPTVKAPEEEVVADVEESPKPKKAAKPKAVAKEKKEDEATAVVQDEAPSAIDEKSVKAAAKKPAKATKEKHDEAEAAQETSELS